MKFLIKTSAVGVSDKKSAKRGEYETSDEAEIKRLQDLAHKFPHDVEVLDGKKKAPKEPEEEEVLEEPKPEKKAGKK